MASKTVKIGSLIVTPVTDRSGNPVYDNEGQQKKRASIGLGQKGKNAQYNLSVEIIVKDATGKVVAKQTDGFINLNDPRTQPDDLLSAGIITEEVAEQMKKRLEFLPDKIKFELMVPRTN